MKKILQNKNLLFAMLGVAVGVLLLVFGSYSSNEVKASEQQNNYSNEELESYTSTLERKVGEHISKIKGINQVSVILTIEGTNEKVYATNGGSKDYVITKDSGGNENALILTEINASVRGIAVVCDYGGNETLKQQIIEMLASLFNIGTNRISVMPA